MKKPRTPIKVLIAKPGLDGHDRGAKVLTMGLRDAGMEVLYTGIRQTPEAIVQTCVQEDVDVVGLSCLCGTYNYHFPKVVELLRAVGMGDVLVIGGGTIRDEDIPSLKRKGIAEVFGPGSSVGSIASFIRKRVNRQFPTTMTE